MARFSVTGLASPHLPLRVINMFAQRDLTIERLTLETRGEWLVLVVDQPDVGDTAAILIAEKLRGMIEVSEVVLDHSPTAVDRRMPCLG